MAMGEEGTYMVTVLWSLTALVSTFHVLRVYTRITCAALYGVDDYFYLVTCILLATHSSVMQIAAAHGYGQHNLDSDKRADANYWGIVGQTFSIFAAGTSKASVGFFLLRLAVIRWQRIVIWFIMVFMMSASVLASISIWATCRPFAYAWDDRIKDGTCFNTLQLTMILAVGAVVADFSFVILPCIFIWKLNAPRREKILIAGSLSLGILAAVAGIKHITEVDGVRNVHVGVITWSHTETAVTLLCIGILCCKPLWPQVFSKAFEPNTIKDSADQKPQEDYAHEFTSMSLLEGFPIPSQTTSNSRTKKQKKSMNFSLLSRLTLVSNADNSHDTMGNGKSKNSLTERERNSKNSGGKDLKGNISGQSKYESWSSEVKRSWIVGEPLSRNEVISKGTCGDYTESGIMTTKSYQVKRGSFIM